MAKDVIYDERYNYEQDLNVAQRKTDDLRYQTAAPTEGVRGVRREFT